MTDFSEHLARLILAEVHSQTLLAAAESMFGKGYFALSEAERRAVDSATWQLVQNAFQWATPEALATLAGEREDRQPPGFVVPTSRATPEKT